MVWRPRHSKRQWGAPVCFLEGASGSTHNGGRSVPDVIENLKRDVTEGVDAATPREVKRIAAVKRPFRYKVRTFDEATEDQKVTDYMTAHAAGAFDFVTKVFREARAAVKPQQGEERETFVQVILIGDVALVGVPAEYFTELGMDIKRRSPFPETYIAELANDWIGYTARPRSVHSWAAIKPGSVRTTVPKTAPANESSTRPWRCSKNWPRRPQTPTSHNSQQQRL